MRLEVELFEPPETALFYECNLVIGDRILDNPGQKDGDCLNEDNAANIVSLKDQCALTVVRHSGDKDGVSRHSDDCPKTNLCRFNLCFHRCENTPQRAQSRAHISRYSNTERRFKRAFYPRGILPSPCYIVNGHGEI